MKVLMVQYEVLNDEKIREIGGEVAELDFLPRQGDSVYDRSMDVFLSVYAVQHFPFDAIYSCGQYWPEDIKVKVICVLPGFDRSKSYILAS